MTLHKVCQEAPLLAKCTCLVTDALNLIVLCNIALSVLEYLLQKLLQNGIILPQYYHKLVSMQSSF